MHIELFRINAHFLCVKECFLSVGWTSSVWVLPPSLCVSVQVDETQLGRQTNSPTGPPSPIPTFTLEDLVWLSGPRREGRTAGSAPRRIRSSPGCSLASVLQLQGWISDGPPWCFWPLHAPARRLPAANPLWRNGFPPLNPPPIETGKDTNRRLTVTVAYVWTLNWIHLSQCNDRPQDHSVYKVTENSLLSHL